MWMQNMVYYLAKNEWMNEKKNELSTWEKENTVNVKNVNVKNSNYYWQVLQREDV